MKLFRIVTQCLTGDGVWGDSVIVKGHFTIKGIERKSSEVCLRQAVAEQ